MNPEKPSLYFDAINYYLAPHRGMAKYVRSLVEVLEKSFFFGEIKGIVPNKIGANNMLPNGLSAFGNSNPMIYEQVSLPSLLKKKQPTFFLFPYNTAPIIPIKGVKYIIVIHDLIFMEPFSKIPLSKNFWQILGRFYRRWITPLSINNAYSIITVSEYSKTKIVERFHIAPDKIVVIPNSIAHLQEKEQETSMDKKKAIFCVGGDAPNKNIAFLIRAYSTLPENIRKEYPLQIAGLRHKKNILLLNRLIEMLGISQSVILLPPLSDEELRNCYVESNLFVFPSIDEGFGIPLLEAMYYGCSVVCSNVSSFPEICGDAAYYFDPTNEQSFVDTITICVSNEIERKSKLEKSVSRLKLYSQEVFTQNVENWAEKIVTLPTLK